MSAQESCVMAGVAAVVGFVTYTVVASMTAPAPVQYYVPVATTARPTVAPMYGGEKKSFGDWLDTAFVKKSNADMGYPGYEEDLKGPKDGAPAARAPAKKEAPKKKGFFG
mmetsp:Transcript_23470/g.42323  ORF Transcript_23470/g.42323 Transcript_23470/m.42323 type:complete len:110 (-) Transcript_23470:380-709(-)